MRSNQFGVSVTNKRTGECIINAYADTNNFYEAWCAVYNETILELQRIEEVQETGDKFWDIGDEIDVCVSLYYTDLKAGDKNIFRMNAESFNAVSANPYEATAKALNRVLDELQKHIRLPSFGRKEHYIGFESRHYKDMVSILAMMAPEGHEEKDELESYARSLETIEAQPYFVFINKENLKGPTVVIPDGYLHISPYAFEGRTDIIDVTLPSGATQICQSAFKNCENLRSVILPDSLKQIGSQAFENCKSLTSIAIPDSVESLGSYTFYGCDSLESVTLPNSGLRIRSCTFDFCISLKEISIPAGALDICSDTFCGCRAMQNIFVDAKNAAYSDIDGVLYNKERTVLIRCPEGKPLKELRIPDSVVEIEDSAFFGCVNLQDIYIPAATSKLSEGAFKKSHIWEGGTKYALIYDGIERIFVDNQNNTYADIDGVLFNKEKTVLLKYPTGCSQTDYTVPDGVTTISDRAFEGCTALRSVTLPKSITHIGRNAFYKCVWLKNINIISANVITCKSGAFDNTTWYALHPAGLVCIGNTVYNHKWEIPENTHIEIAEGMTCIAESAFENQKNLVGITIPSSMVIIGRDAFYNSGLIDVEMPNANIDIERNAFSGTPYERKT